MKKFISICLVLLFLVPAQVFAHSKMTSSSPANNDVLSESPSIISMDFNTDIASLSTFTLENDQGELIGLHDIVAEAHKLSGIPDSPLANNSYTVKWTIIGADGHTVDGNYSFKVNAPEVVQEPVPQTTTETPAETEAPVATPENNISAGENNLDADQSEKSTSSKVWPIIVIAIIIVAAATLASRRSKK